MEAKLKFANVAFAQPDKYTVPVKLGQTFRMKVEGSTGLTWGVDGKDPILSYTDVAAEEIEITTEATGKSRVFLLNEEDHVVFRLHFEVYSGEEATQFDVPAPEVENIP